MDSGIGQSRIAGVLLRAEAINNAPLFKKLSEAALRAYDLPETEGGVITVDGDVTWIEEMADLRGRSFRVLNGHITGLSGILDFYEITKDPKWKTLFDRGVAAVKRELPKFDAGFSSYYSLYMPSSKRPMAPLHEYNALHVSQLLWLYDLTEDAEFVEYASRFQAYEINNDVFSASSSIDATTHGPDKVRASYGDDYWSTGQFPAWFQVQTKKPEWIRGVAIDLNLLSEAPKSFTVSAFVNGDWKQVFSVPEGNTNRNIDAIFPEPVMTDKVRLDIPTHNGDGLVAIRNIMLLRRDHQFAPVTNDCNHSQNRFAKVNKSNPEAAFDGDPNTAMQIYCDGWLTFPTDGAGKFIANVAHTDGLTVSESDDLSTWTPIAATIGSFTLSAPITKKFARISFTSAAGSISEISRKLD